MAFNLADVLKDVSNSDTGRKQIEYIALDLIDADEINFYALSEIEKLANNIATIGLQQPLVLRPSDKTPGRYKTVSGHRRRAALKLLVQENPERWSEVPCIVDPDAVSPALQELKMIFGNADTRRMSNADLDQQAQRVEALLYQLKEEGYEFPGRMRDHVAEAVSVSKSKLARLKVIRENLAAVWVDSWKDGTIGESVAYNLSRMPKSWQGVIHNVWSEKPKDLSADTVILIRDRFKNVVGIKCEHGLNLCAHTVTMMERCAIGNNGGCYHCCFDCSSLQTCEYCCPQAHSKQKELKAVAKQANLDVKREQEERDRPGAEFARMVWDRIGKARSRSGCSIETLVKARGESIYNASFDDPKQEKMESGEGKYGPESTISFGYQLYAKDAMRMVAVADALGCSVDYLLGRTDDRQSHLSNALPENPVPYQGTTWQTGKPSVLGDYIILVRFSKASRLIHQKMTWNGNGWEVHGEQFEFDDAQVICWVPMPKIPEKSQSATNESCITGISPNGQCGAAAHCNKEYTCCLQCPDDSCNGRCGWIDDVAEEPGNG